MTLIDILEIFESLLYKDAEAFHVNEVTKEEIWNGISIEFKEQDNKRNNYYFEKETVKNKGKKKGKKK